VSAVVLGWTNSLAAFVHQSPQLGESSHSFGLPLLHLAASRGQAPSVRILLSGSVSPQLMDFTGRSALFHATTNDNSEVIALLKAHGTQRTVFDAIWLADVKLLETLLAADPARAHATNAFCGSALLFATERGDLQIVRSLLRHGANPNPNTPASQHFSPGRLVSGTTPLQLAAWSNRTDLAEVLVAAKANLAAANQLGFTALHYAAAQGNHEMAAWLLARGANPNVTTVVPVVNGPRMSPLSFQQRSNLGWTPLHLAVRHGHPALIELLVAKGAKLEVADSQGRTPADLAQNSFGVMSSPWAPTPYTGLTPSMHAVNTSRDPARTQAVVEVLKKLGAVIPTTRGASFLNSGPRPSFPPPSLTPPSAAPPTKR
jgi:ankyrin repeat protein